MSEENLTLYRVICSQCGARSWLRDGETGVCTDCGGAYRPMGPLEGLVDRWFAPPAQHTSEFYPRHRKLVELMWTSQGRGRDTYNALKPPRVSYGQFVNHATDIVLRGLAEGWIVAELPVAPVPNDHAYSLRFVDPDRWADELAAAFFGQLPASLSESSELL